MWQLFDIFTNWVHDLKVKFIINTITYLSECLDMFIRYIIWIINYKVKDLTYDSRRGQVPYFHYFRILTHIYSTIKK